MIEFSIVIINFNYERFLKDCLLSCINQNIKENYEIILVDDGSTDNSLSIANNFKCKYFSIYRTKNLGIEKAANLGFKKAKGLYITRVDSDDKLKKNYLFKMKQEITKRKNKNKVFFYSNYDIINENDKLLSKKKLPLFSKEEIFERGDFLATGTLIPKKIFVKLGGYSTIYKNSGLENYDFILRFIKSSYIGYRVNQNLFFLRHHNKNLSLVKKKNIRSFGQNLFNKLKIGKYKINENHPLNY